MKKYSENGFTIVELLVGMNLGFIAITLTVTSFLFYNKFYHHFIHSIESRQMVFNAAYHINELLHKQEYFFIQNEGALCKILFDNSKIISIEDLTSIRLNEIPVIEDLDELNIIISLKTGAEIKINNENISDWPQNQTGNRTFTSFDIESIQIVINKNDYSSTIFYSPIKYTLKRFINNAEPFFN